MPGERQEENETARGVGTVKIFSMLLSYTRFVLFYISFTYAALMCSLSSSEWLIGLSPFIASPEETTFRCAR